jgi:hypothetical protein
VGDVSEEHGPGVPKASWDLAGQYSAITMVVSAIDKNEGERIKCLSVDYDVQ